MSSGDLREMLDFYRRPIQADDSYGNVEGPWQFLFKAPARIVPEGGSEEVQEDRRAAVKSVAITIRYHKAAAGLLASDRAVDARSGVRYNLTQVTADERRQFVELLAFNDGLIAEDAFTP